MKKSIITVIVIVAILIIVGLIYSAQTRKANSPVPITQNGEVDTSDWETYRNEELGFEFRYPEEWGEAKQAFPNQLRIVLPGSSFHKILININDQQPLALKASKIALLQVDFDIECNFYLLTSRQLEDGKFARISMEQTKRKLPQEECQNLFESMPEERKDRRVTTPHAYTIVYLEEPEIPEIMQEDYQEFKLFMESFKTI